MALRMIARIASRSAPANGCRGDADRLGAESGFGHRQFDTLHQLGMRIEVQKRCKPAVDAQCLFVAAADGQVPQAPILGRKSVDQAGDPADRAQQPAFQDQIIDAAEEPVALAALIFQVGDAADVLRRFLYGDELRLVG